MELVDEARADRLCGELRAAHADVGRRPLLHLAHGAGVELPLDPCPRGRGRRERPGVDNLVRRPPARAREAAPTARQYTTSPPPPQTSAKSLIPGFFSSNAIVSQTAIVS